MIDYSEPWRPREDILDRITEWIGQEHPTPALKQLVTRWIDSLFDDALQFPSDTLAWPSPEGIGHLRHARVPETDVDVIYHVNPIDHTFAIIRIERHLDQF